MCCGIKDKNKKYQGGKRLWNFTKSCKNLENKKI